MGYGIPGLPDWTYACILAGVDAALGRMRCGVLDIVHLHSCPLPILEAGEVIRALEDSVQAGKVRVAAYSGDNAELEFALRTGRFGAVQTSLSRCDQANLAGRLPALQALGLGVIAKRPIAGAVWQEATRPEAYAEGHYWDRWQAMALGPPPAGLSWNEVALRFTAHCPGVSSSIVGTRNRDHFRQNLAWVEKGPLPSGLVERLQAPFRGQEDAWFGLI